MNYFTGLATSPVFEFPFSSFQTHSVPSHDNDINAILASIAPPIGTQIYNQPQTITLQCVPQINTGIGNNTVVYQVPENMPIDMILQQLGINTNTLQASNTTNNYYQSLSQPIDLVFQPSTPPRRRRLVCREVLDEDDDGYLRRPSTWQRPSSRSGRPQESPVALHNILSKVWDRAEHGSRDLPSSRSAPDLNSQWRNRTPIPQSGSASNVWQAMRNASPPMPPNNRNAVDNVWHRADDAVQQRANHLSDMFNRMRQPTGNIMQPPPPPLQNREAVQDFMAARNIPYGVYPAQPNREAVENFMAARNIPYGVNPAQQNQQAAQNFMAARNVPLGINSGPPPSNAAINNFLAARYVPFGNNPGPPPPNAAVNNFLAARTVPSGYNQPNPAIANAWNRASAAPQAPPMINFSNNQGPSSVSNMWNRMQQAPSYPSSPMGFPQRSPSYNPAPMSFSSILNQAHRQHIPYAGGA